MAIFLKPGKTKNNSPYITSYPNLTNIHRDNKSSTFVVS